MTVLLQDHLLEPCQRAKDRPSSDLSRRSMADGTTKHHLGCYPPDPMDPISVAKAFCRWRFVRKGKNRKETTFFATVGVARKNKASGNRLMHYDPRQDPSAAAIKERKKERKMKLG